LIKQVDMNAVSNKLIEQVDMNVVSKSWSNCCTSALL
jgi:hypothetical protein